MPNSDPRPNMAPSENRVDAFTYTAAASTASKNFCRLFLSSDKMASECLEEYLPICESASLMPETILTDIFWLRNSRPKSVALAFLSRRAGYIFFNMPKLFGSAKISTSFLTRNRETSGKNFWATSLWRSKVSSELHMLGRWVLALKTTAAALESFADLSTNVWHTPAPVSMKGTVAFFRT